jgi:hypothetical protein
MLIVVSPLASLLAKVAEEVDDDDDVVAVAGVESLVMEIRRPLMMDRVNPARRRPLAR